MSKSCITCGKGMNKSVRKMIETYVKQGKDLWIYKDSEKGDYQLVTSDKIKIVLKKNKTKKGYKKGFSYAHITEFKGY